MEENGKESVKVYCFFGSGNTMELDDDLWGDVFATQCLDFNEDQTRDICFVQHLNTQDGLQSRVTIYVASGDTYEILPFSEDVYISSMPQDTNRGLEQYSASAIEVFQDRDGTNALRCGGTIVHGQVTYQVRWTLYYHDGEWHIRDMKETEAEVVQEET